MVVLVEDIPTVSESARRVRINLRASLGISSPADVRPIYSTRTHNHFANLVRTFWRDDQRLDTVATTRYPELLR
jgi:hypothetical protein